MGSFQVNVTVASLAALTRTEELALLVDTRSTLSWIPRNVLERVGAGVFSCLPFTSLDGRRFERDVTALMMTVDGNKACVTVAFGEPGEEAVLGLTALESLGFTVDPVAKKLVPCDLLALVGR